MPALSEAQVIAALCRKDYRSFVRTFWPTVVTEPCHWNWHMDLGCDLIQEAYERVFARRPKDWDLLTNQPPGTSKSLLHSIMAMPWAWTRDPSLRFLAASYSAPCAEKLSLYCRDVMKSELYQACFPEVKIRADVDNKSHFMTNKGGERFATSVGGSATGLSHAHILVIDDPLNPQQATSDAELLAANHWITHTLLNRKVDMAVSFVDMVGQRLCQGDPFDEFKQINPRVKHVVIPADTDYEISPPELKEFYVDGFMDPKRKGKEVLEEEKAKGESYYASQLGQCLVAGTLVETSSGPVCIERVRAGDCVLTREGFRTVMWAGETKKVDSLASVLFSNGSVLTGTPDHPIWTRQKGWVPLDALGGGMYNVVTPYQLGETTWDDWDGRRRLLRRLSNSTESSTTATGERNTSATGMRVGTDCTATFGESIEGLSPLAMTSTTRTATRVTIELEILSAFPNETTGYDTPHAFGLRSIENFLMKSALSVLPGTNPQRVRNIIKPTVESLFDATGKPLQKSSVLVLPVGLSSGRSRSVAVRTQSNTVPASAKRNVESDPTPATASGVTRSSHLAITGPSAAACPVRPSGGGAAVEWGTAVYDLMVEGIPEFFANGILVHNSPVPPGGGTFKCDRLRFGRPPDMFRMLARGWDKASTSAQESRKACWTAGVKMGLDNEGRYWILDVVRGRWDTFARENIIHSTAKRDGRGCLIVQEQEAGGGGKDSAVGTIRRLAGFRVRTLVSRGKKETRAEEFSVQVNAGTVWLPDTMRLGKEWTGWARDLVDELRFWPFSKYLDHGDACALAFSGVARGRVRVGPLKKGEGVASRTKAL